MAQSSSFLVRSPGSSAFEAALDNRQLGTQTKMYQKRVGISAKETSKIQRIYRRMHCKLRDPAFLSTRRTLPGSKVRIVSPQKDWIETVQKEEDSLQAAEEDSSASDSIDLLTAKAMLHAAQFVSVG